MIKKHLMNMISRPVSNFLKICFWLGILMFALQIFLPFLQIGLISNGLKYEPNIFIKVLSIIMTIPVMIIFGYSLFFFYKYDRYSKSGIYFFFFHFFYAFIYFYKVIWKRKRELVNSFECEPVLGNSLMIETEETDEK